MEIQLGAVLKLLWGSLTPTLNKYLCLNAHRLLLMSGPPASCLHVISSRWREGTGQASEGQSSASAVSRPCDLECQDLICETRVNKSMASHLRCPRQLEG